MAMKSDVDDAIALVDSDVEELKIAAKKLFSDVSKHGGAAFGVYFVKWMACLAAIYLLILDRTNWRSKMLTSLLIPYIFLSLPGVIFNFLSGDVGKWIAFVAVVLRLFFPKHFPDWLEMPGSLILLLVVSPHLLAHHIRGTWIGSVISLFIGCYLLQEGIRVSGGFRNSFTQPRGVSKHPWDNPYFGLPCLGSNRPCHKIDIHLPFPPSCVSSSSNTTTASSSINVP